MYVCLTNMETEQLLGLLGQELLGVTTSRGVGRGSGLSLWALLSQIKYHTDATHVGNAPWTANRWQS